MWCAGKLAADIGAGSGFVTEGLLERGLRVIAVDRSEAMLEEMRRKFGDGAAVEYRIGEAESLPLADGSVDYVFANMYLHHVESPPEAIREMARIVKPGGRLVITDLDRHDLRFPPDGALRPLDGLRPAGRGPVVCRSGSCGCEYRLCR